MLTTHMERLQQPLKSHGLELAASRSGTLRFRPLRKRKAKARLPKVTRDRDWLLVEGPPGPGGSPAAALRAQTGLVLGKYVAASPGASRRLRADVPVPPWMAEVEGALDALVASALSRGPGSAEGDPVGCGALEPVLRQALAPVGTLAAADAGFELEVPAATGRTRLMSVTGAGEAVRFALRLARGEDLPEDHLDVVAAYMCGVNSAYYFARLGFAAGGDVVAETVVPVASLCAPLCRLAASATLALTPCARPVEELLGNNQVRQFYAGHFGLRLTVEDGQHKGAGSGPPPAEGA